MSSKLIAGAVLTTLATFSLTSLPAAAGERWRYEFESRAARHMELIEEGRHAGTLTRGEYNSLKREQRQIASMKRRFLNDGELSWTEKQSLRYAQDAANNHIFSERNDHEKSRRWYHLARL